MDVKPQVVEIVMRDGKGFSEKVVYPKGNPNNPVTSEEVIAAFRGMASYAAKPLGGAKIDDAIALALRLEEVDDVAVLAKVVDRITRLKNTEKHDEIGLIFLPHRETLS